MWGPKKRFVYVAPCHKRAVPPLHDSECHGARASRCDVRAAAGRIDLTPCFVFDHEEEWTCLEIRP